MGSSIKTWSPCRNRVPGKHVFNRTDQAGRKLPSTHLRHQQSGTCWSALCDCCSIAEVPGSLLLCITYPGQFSLLLMIQLLGILLSPGYGSDWEVLPAISSLIHWALHGYIMVPCCKGCWAVSLFWDTMYPATSRRLQASAEGWTQGDAALPHPGCVRSTDSLPSVTVTSSKQVRELKRWTVACTDGPRQAGEGKSSWGVQTSWDFQS